MNNQSNLFTVNYQADYDTCVNVDMDFDPADYLDYDSKEEVEEEIGYKFEIDFGDLNVSEEYNTEINIPDEFWEKWRELKSEYDNTGSTEASSK